MNILTDEQIIKALECCAVSGTCDYCPLKSDKKNCVSILSKNSLALFNCLEKEIKSKNKMIIYLKNEILKAKSEARKEFWERLKQKRCAKGSRVIYIERGNELLKEMEGEETEKALKGGAE